MKTLEEIRQQLKDRNLSVVAKEAGIHYNSLYAIAKGVTNPRYATVQKLIKYLDK